jgi:hypothetical protein
VRVNLAYALKCLVCKSAESFSESKEQMISIIDYIYGRFRENDLADVHFAV